ncbi:MAG: hypothetical protein FJX74_19805, partial [Armatimonadetes bacterium]|nr:hypothetical protein [Armatimonadota bacterium]
PPTYVLGPGDEVELRVWGRGTEYVNLVQVISNDGALYGPTAGRLPVAGKTIVEAGDTIRAAYVKYYPECDVLLTVSMLRPVEVMVIGDVLHPGRHLLPGPATVFNALYAAGGPLESGSLRRIDVRRGTTLVASVDLYDYLLRGDTTADITLLAGDTVFVHVIGPVVALTGEVRRQARYEIVDRVTLGEALGMCGGIRGSAYGQRVQVRRAERNTERIVVEADLVNEAETWRTVELQDGDEVVVLPVLEELRNVVTVEGAVRRPDSYAWAEGLTLSGVIEAAEGLSPEALRESVHVLRESPQGRRDVLRVNVSEVLAGRAEDVTLQPRDIVRVFAGPEVEPNVVYAEGAVLLPGEQEFTRGMTVADLVRGAGGLLVGAYGESATLVRKDAAFQDTYVAVPVGRIMSGAADLDVPLQNRDRLIVALREERARERFVEIAGAVAHPDRYPFGEGLRLSDLIGLAGGLTPDAGGAVTIIKGQTAGASETVAVDVAALKAGRPLPQDPLLREGDTVAVQSVGGFSVEGEFAEVRGRVARPGVYPLIGADGRRLRASEVLALAGGPLPDAYPEMACVYHTERSLLDRRTRVATVKGALQESESVLPDEQEASPATLYNPARGEEMLLREARERIAQLISGGRGEAFVVLPPRALADVRITTGVPVDLTRAAGKPRGREDLQLQHGDILAVFQRPDTVVVDGAVAAPGPQPFVEGATLRQYLYEAGRPTRDADLRFAVVVHYNGQARRLQSGDRVRPGDWLLVPTKYTVHKVSGAAQESITDRITQLLSTFVILRKL